MDLTQTHETLLRAQEMLAVFAPHEAIRRSELLSGQRKLIHYTSAVAAVSILRDESVWMRNVRCMNDYMEVEHGFHLLQKAYQSTSSSHEGAALRAVSAEIDKIFPGLSEECISWFDGWLPSLRTKTYVACLSEHVESDQAYGRLSMWRSYTSNQVGVGLIINPAPLYSVTNSFGAYSTPVHYYNDSDLHKTFLFVADNVKARREFIESLGRQDVKGYFCMMLRGIAMGTKHPGFYEEREWRIMHTEGLDEAGKLIRDVECVGGVPQPVYKIPLKTVAESGLPGITIPELLEGVIIGPTQFPGAVWDALAIELDKAGVKNASEKIVCSDIPLRT